MSYHWIDPAQFSFQCLLLMDRFLLRQVCAPEDEEAAAELGIALAYNPAVAWYCRERAPELAEGIGRLLTAAPRDCSPERVREAERRVLDRNDWAVVYVYPEVMNRNCPYIREWDKERLFELADFTGRLVLDVGAGTGRLTFAAAERARRVYACEPVDRLREYMREKAEREGIANVTVLDGTCERIPFEDGVFDIVMSGHVVGDDYDRELRELERVVRSGGWILDCPGEDDRKKPLDQELLRRGFEHFFYESKTGGHVYRYRKRVLK